MNILFVHQNFPGQFKHLAPALAERGHTVLALTLKSVLAGNAPGVRIVSYALSRGSSANTHPWISDLEAKVIRGEACYKAALQLRAEEFHPDVIIAHPGWGESLFLKDVWPAAKLGLYCEFFYRSEGTDIGFDPEFTSAETSLASRLRLKNMHYQLQLDVVDAAISPTHWQASTFPPSWQEKISVIHDGIDTERIKPNPQARLVLGSGLTLTRDDEVITYVARNLEPYRGFHIFMRALPGILARRPNATVLIVGGDGVSYGKRHPSGKRWRDIFVQEIGAQISASDWQRVRFLGNTPYTAFISLLQVSSVHVYLTYPFVLSWSLLEAMSAGCAVVASDTAPVREVIQQDLSGRLTNFFDAAALSDEICALLANKAQRVALGTRARAMVVEHFDLKKNALPKQLAWVEQGFA